MNTQDRAVVKSLLQYMTDKFLTGGDEFRAALKHFNITTTSYQSYEGFTKTRHVVMVFAADRIDRCPHGFRVEFASKEEAEAYETKMRATGDQPVDTKVLKARETHAKALAANIEAAHAEALEMNEEFDIKASARSFKADQLDAAHAEALGMNQSRSETIRAIIAQAIHAGANSFGGVIGEHEELVETLRNAGYLTAAHKVDAVYDTLDASNHKAVRKSWLAALRDVSAAL